MNAMRATTGAATGATTGVTTGAAAADEREMMRSLHEGTCSSLGALYERTAPYLYPLALRIVGSRERACAVLEDLFEEIWRDRTRWRGAAAIPSIEWIARCRELALAQAGPLAHGGRPAQGGPEARRPMTAPLFGPRAFDPAAPRAFADASRSDADEPAAADPRAAAREALASLPETDRRALEEVYFRGANAREVAVVIGAATSDAAMLLRSALVRFRERVAELEDAPAEAEAS